MPDYLDMLRCKTCGVVYLPKFTVTGRLVPHCSVLPLHSLPVERCSPHIPLSGKNGETDE